MKILVLVHVFNKVGGILNHTEQLICGLKDIGHEVSFVMAKPLKTPPKNIDVTEKPKTAGPWEKGPGTNLWFNPGKGWHSNAMSFLNKESVASYVKFANEHDIVIHNSIFGFANQESEKDLTWLPMITEVKAKQVAVIHDGNLKRNYAWLWKLQEHFSALACVHPAAIKQTDFFSTPRNMVLNPFDLDVMLRKTVHLRWDSRDDVLLSPQTFKTMKRVESLVAAVPYIKGKVLVAGDGIERSYMCSVDKCKPHYYATKEVDPDVTEDRINRKIWDNAVANGMDYLGFITGEERDDILSKSKFLIDSSWSVGYGEHFNRTLFEAMMLGAIPIAVNYGVSDNEEGNGTLLKAGVNYLMLRKDMTPKEYGDAVNDWMFNLTEDEARVIINNNLELLKKLDRKLIAKQFVSLAFGEDAGFFEKNMIGNSAADPKAVKKAAEMWDEQFVAKQESSLEEFFG